MPYPVQLYLLLFSCYCIYCSLVLFYHTHLYHHTHFGSPFIWLYHCLPHIFTFPLTHCYCYLCLTPPTFLPCICIAAVVPPPCSFALWFCWTGFGMDRRTDRTVFGQGQTVGWTVGSHCVADASVTLRAHVRAFCCLYGCTHPTTRDLWFPFAFVYVATTPHTRSALPHTLHTLHCYTHGLPRCVTHTHALLRFHSTLPLLTSRFVLRFTPFAFGSPFVTFARCGSPPFVPPFYLYLCLAFPTFYTFGSFFLPSPLCRLALVLDTTLPHHTHTHRPRVTGSALIWLLLNVPLFYHHLHSFFFTHLFVAIIALHGSVVRITTYLLLPHCHWFIAVWFTLFWFYTTLPVPLYIYLAFGLYCIVLHG